MNQIVRPKRAKKVKGSELYKVDTSAKQYKRANEDVLDLYSMAESMFLKDLFSERCTSSYMQLLEIYNEWFKQEVLKLKRKNKFIDRHLIINYNHLFEAYAPKEAV
jgi:hypothetical protein